MSRERSNDDRGPWTIQFDPVEQYRKILDGLDIPLEIAEPKRDGWLVLTRRTGASNELILEKLVKTVFDLWERVSEENRDAFKGRKQS